MSVFWDILKISALIVIAYLAYRFIQPYQQNNGLFDNLSTVDNVGNGTLEISETKLWNPVSPMKGAVKISSKSTPHATNASDEYIYIQASEDNNGLIDLSGWSVRSIVSNTRMYFPPGVLLLKMQKGTNKTSPVYLAPGEYAILHSGVSPISNIANAFHTNKCIGYISKLNNKFKPKLKSECNDPSQIIKPTPPNIIAYGKECIEFLQNADSCKSYTTEMPAHLLPACRNIIARKLNYHACLAEALNKEGFDIFNNGGWYLYLGYDAEIWRNNYEALQLLDENGLVVDVFKY